MTAANDPTHPYDALTPDVILGAVEQQGALTDGHLMPLNSYENRVYQVGIEDDTPIIAKFYRPGRWAREQILEEHKFCAELVEHDVPVVAPLALQGETLFEHGDFYFSLYPRSGGYAPELDNLDTLFLIGRVLGRLHLVAAAGAFEHRPALSLRVFGNDSVAFIQEHFMPVHLAEAYTSLAADLLSTMETIFSEARDATFIRTHCDFHVGNLLWRDDHIHLVDFDDSRMAPAVQDIWMLLSGDRPRRLAQLSEILEGYAEFYDFDARELRLIETLRTLRMLHYSAWLGRRWDDPAFPRNFPWFNTMKYWEEHILQLREQLAALHEPPLTLQI